MASGWASRPSAWRRQGDAGPRRFPQPVSRGRYGVDVESFEAIVRAELDKPPTQVDLCIVDEIGKMECLSRLFTEAVTRVLDSPVPVLATIAAKGVGFIAEVKSRLDVEIVTVTAANRDASGRV